MFLTKCITLCATILLCSNHVISVNVHMNGDIIIGATFHIKNNGESGYTAKFFKSGIEDLEVFYYAIDKVNTLNLVPGVKFGGHAVDSNDVKMDEAAFTQFTQIRDAKEETEKPMFLGVIDGSRGNYSAIIKSKLTMLNIPTLVVPNSPAVFFDKSEYNMVAKTFTTVFNDYNPLIAILKKMNVNKVQVIVSDAKRRKHILDFLIQNGIQTEKVHQLKYPQNDECETVVNELIAHKSIRTVLLFNQHVDACIFDFVNKKQPKNDFQWISDHSIGVMQLSGYESMVKGLISVNVAPVGIARPNQLPEFKSIKNYSMTLTPNNNKRNIWFREFFEDQFNCYSGRLNRSETRIRCGDNIKFQNERDIFYETILNGVYAFAYAFKNAWLYKCGKTFGICKELREMNGEQFFNDYLMKVNFT
ncbi:metabotropic glutamate receptor 3-like protein, partial [Leptotrombidium deliense]